jgi:hypothetical protein
MATEETVQKEVQPARPVKKALKRPVRNREVILAPDLYEAVLESIEQDKEGKTQSHEEVKQRNGL